MYLKLLILIIIFQLSQGLLISQKCNLIVENLKQIIYSGDFIILKDINKFSMSNYLELSINQETVNWSYVNSDRIIKIFVPTTLNVGKYQLELWDIINENCAETEFEFLGKRPNLPDSLNPYDPDPGTNLGERDDYSEIKLPVVPGKKIKNKPGGSSSNNKEDCDLFHVIDGVFTDSVGYGTTKEWSTITPLNGTFSNLYLDYCSKTKILHIMNDWKLGNGNYDTLTCYNEFEFSTGGGTENWKVKIYNSISKGIIVTLNGKDVSKDTNYVVNGRYGNDKSLLVDSNHTMWEFGVKASSGLFIMRIYRDEVGVKEIKPNVRLICDDNGYGTIPEPHIISGNLTDDGSELTMSKRYIPINGVAGLETEPYSFGGNLSNDTTVIISSKDNKKIINLCKDNHKIDGKFTNETGFENEWKDSQPAKGMFSNLYAEFCKGKLYILNDWKLGYEEPDKKNCYNLFELFTGNGEEHWGIHVYNDNERKPVVFRNGVDVSSDTNYVEDGKYGFEKSPLEDNEHTIYEFAIKAMEGNWKLFLCDPGPSSFCDKKTEFPRQMDDKVTALDNNGLSMNKIDAFYNDTISINIGSQNFSNFYGNRFVFDFTYDRLLFYPLLSNIISQNQSNFDSLNVVKTQPGILKITGFSNDDAFKSKFFLKIDGLILAGHDSISRVSGTMRLGNKARIMRESKMNDLQIVADSRCPLTKNLVISPAIFIRSINPNPINDQETSVLVESNYKTAISMKIRNIYGGEVFSIDNININPGINNIELNPVMLNSGVYFLEIDDGINSNVIKIIKF